MNQYDNVVKVQITFRLATPLLLRSGEQEEFADQTIERSPDKQLHINGYVWSSLLRRSLQRIKDGNSIAEKIGDYETTRSVSPLWCESSFVNIPDVDILTGTKINRGLGSVESGALYSQEIVPPGIIISLKFNYFCDQNFNDHFVNLLSDALYPIKQGIENIGGGWSYGYGRLTPLLMQMCILDLKDPEDRKPLWNYDQAKFKTIINNEDEIRKPEKIVQPWTEIEFDMAITEGQLFAIGAEYLSLDAYRDIQNITDLPDKYMHRQLYTNDSLERITKPVIPGKAIRQALISSQLERKWRTKDEKLMCDTPSDVCTCSMCVEYRKGIRKKINNPDCKCKRCEWFGNSDKRGLVSVFDAKVNEGKSEILHRISLCEHSMQNINLFSGEYLTGGKFSTKVIIDHIDDKNEIINEIEVLLKEMSDVGEAPPGWYRIGTTSTATGQIQIDNLVTTVYGE